ncbi:MAG: conjugal transfer protein TraG N-terminal domain-containing protein, partial [Sulfurimonas sp.]
MIKRLLFLLLVIFSSQLLAADVIYAWGYGDILEKTLVAVNFTFAHSDYAGIFKFALLLSLSMALITSAQLGMKGDMLSLPKLFFISFGVSAVFITYKIDVVVHDVSTNQNYVVNQVPWAVAKPMVFFSGIEKHIGEIMETSFAVPGDISYSTGGFLSPFGIMDAAGGAKITDPNLFQSVDNFIIDCVVPDIQIGYLDVSTLAHSSDLWGEFSHSNPARVTYYYKSGRTPVAGIETCTDAYNLINTDITTYTNGAGMDSLAAMLGGYTGTQVASILGTSSSYFMNYSSSAQSYLKQSIILNQFNSTYQNYSAMNGMGGSSTAYGVGKADQTAQANMIISGILGTKYVPILRGILTVIVMALTPILALMLLTPMFWKILSGYLVTLVWLSLWHVGEVILNFIILVKASHYMVSVVDANGMYSMVSKPVVDGSFMSYVQMA